MKIEAVTKADAKELLAIYAPYVKDTAISFEYEVPSVAEFETRMEGILAKYPYLKAVEGNEIVGYAYAAPFKMRKAYDYAVETTIYVRQDVRQKGIGKALYERLEHLLCEMGILNMNACIAVPKKEEKHLTMDSVRFHEAMGFHEVGLFHDCGYKFHTWYHMMWMEKMIGEHRVLLDPVRFGSWKA